MYAQHLSVDKMIFEQIICC